MSRGGRLVSAGVAYTGAGTRGRGDWNVFCVTLSYDDRKVNHLVVGYNGNHRLFATTSCFSLDQSDGIKYYLFLVTKHVNFSDTPLVPN